MFVGYNKETGKVFGEPQETAEVIYLKICRSLALQHLDIQKELPKYQILQVVEHTEVINLAEKPTD